MKYSDVSEWRKETLYTFEVWYLFDGEWTQFVTHSSLKSYREAQQVQKTLVSAGAQAFITSTKTEHVVERKEVYEFDWPTSSDGSDRCGDMHDNGYNSCEARKGHIGPHIDMGSQGESPQTWRRP